jgi:hypothetical protein
MRQVRVKEISCHPKIWTNSTECISPLYTESEESYGPSGEYKWSANSDGFLFSGQSGQLYSKSGFIEIITPDLNQSIPLIQQLQVLLSKKSSEIRSKIIGLTA